MLEMLEASTERLNAWLLNGLIFIYIDCAFSTQFVLNKIPIPLFKV